MRSEIGKLQRDLAVTTVYVTHDQIEAMTLGHRVAVIRKGVLQQIAPPQVLYDQPTNLFVAGFIGSPSMNFLSATLHRDASDRYSAEIGSNTLDLPQSLPVARPALANYVDKPIIVGIRPEEMEDGSLAGTHPGRMLHGTVELVEPLGSDLMTHLSIDAQEASGLEDITELAEDSGEAMPLAEDRATVVARFNARSHVKVGDAVQITVNTEQLHFFDATTGSSVWGE
jgi:multiple sugar transport system ATP-binding protein